jgi:3-oxoadipate CoA-transferase, beta subunit
MTMTSAGDGDAELMPRPWTMDEVAAHVAGDLAAGSYVNVGIGLPTLIPRHIPAGREVLLHSENGMLGIGPPPVPEEADPELIDASKNPVTLVPGGCYCSHSEAFMMITGGHIDVTVLGAFQVSEHGDLANWAMPGDKIPAVGGAMDLAAGAEQVLVICRHIARDGRPKLVAQCSYPLTAPGVVRRVYTDLITADIRDGRFVVVAAAPGLRRQYLERVTAGRLVWPGQDGSDEPGSAMPGNVPDHPAQAAND